MQWKFMCLVCNAADDVADDGWGMFGMQHGGLHVHAAWDDADDKCNVPVHASSSVGWLDATDDGWYRC